MALDPRAASWGHTSLIHALRSLAPAQSLARVAVAAAVLLASLLAACSSAPPAGGVHVLTVDGMINPVVANYVDRGVIEAHEAGADLVVIQLNTPGGLDTSMREIVQRILSSEVPIAVYVSPSGARAASAGTFILMAAHVAAMAPATATGAAHPVSAGGGDIPGEDLRAKAENDAVAYIRGIAESHDRNADWAERAVRESISASASEAVDLQVVDLQAADLDEFLAAIDGGEVSLASGVQVVLQVQAAPRHEIEMSFAERFLMQISDPNIAFLLLSLGSLALIIELYNPTGIGLVVGGLALTVAFFSLGTLPVNWAGVALIILAVSLFVAELLVVSGGLLALVGAVTLALGALFLTTSNQPAFEVSRWLAYGLPAVVGVSVASLAMLLLRLRRRVATVGKETLIGGSGVALGAVRPGEPGYVLMHGERWRARVDDESVAPILPGERAVITSVEGLFLTVRAADTSDSAGPASVDSNARMVRTEGATRDDQGSGPSMAEVEDER